VAQRDFQLVGGHPALDFVNTVDWRWDRVRRTDLLDTLADLLAWARQAGIVTAAEARAFATAAARDAGWASRALVRARRLREAIGRIFEAVANGVRPAARDLRLFNAFLSAALRRRRLALRGTGYEWSWAPSNTPALDALLSPVVLAAAELLSSPQRLKIRACAAEDCGWLFLDTSRSGRRRWCTMQSCGNRAKARRFYARAAASTRTGPDSANGMTAFKAGKSRQ
jgi:predicted RNA-binding Zn ribbon-like protein